MDDEKKNLTLAYVLAIIAPMFSIHRHYLGKHGSAILQMLLWFTGIGVIWFIIDLVTMKSMVDEANYRLMPYEKVDVYINDRPVRTHSSYKQLYNKKEELKRKIKSESTGESKERKILNVAKKYNGKVTVTQIAMETDITLEDAEKMLKELVRKGYVNMDVSDKGVIIYEFYELT